MLSWPPALLAAFTRRVHKPSRALIEGEQGLDERVGQFAREAVGAEQEKVPCLGLEFKDVGRHAALRAEGARDHVAEGRAPRFGRGHAAHAHLLLDQRVVVRELLEPVFAQAVAAAVSDVDDPDAALFHHQADQGGAHPTQFRISERPAEDGAVALADGPLSKFRHCGRIASGRALELRHHLVHGQRTGNLPSRRAAHAVAHQVHPVLDGKPEGVFVGWSFAAAVGDRRSREVNNSRGQVKLPQSPVYTGLIPLKTPKIAPSEWQRPVRQEARQGAATAERPAARRPQCFHR